MALTTNTIRSRLATALEAVSGWRESRWAPGRFGADPQPDLHLSFAIGVTDTGVLATEGRHRPAEGILVESTVDVSWAYRLRGDAQTSDYAAALTAEAAAVVALVAVSRSGGLTVNVSRLLRNTDTDGWLLGTIRLRCLHQLALT